MNLVFNELSLKDISCDLQKGITIFENFIKTYSYATNNNIGFSRVVYTSVNLNNVEISNGYYSSKWRNDKNGDKDLQLRYKRMCDLQEVLTQISPDDFLIQHENEDGEGLLIAHENNGTLISIVNHSKWKKYKLECECYSSKTDEISKVYINNIYDINCVKEHRAEIIDGFERFIYNCNNKNELLTNLDNWFPNLVFSEVAITQIKAKLETQHIPIVCEKLFQLEKYFSCWDRKGFNKDCFPKRTISSESQETLNRFKENYTFKFGEKYVTVSYHLRYTGNINGRIYFSPDYKTGKGFICSLTTKLPTITYPQAKI